MHKLIILFLVFLPAQLISAKIIKIENVQIKKHYQELSQFEKWYYPEPLYSEAKNTREFQYQVLEYESDEHRVKAFLVKPKDPAITNRPTIIWNRGGTGNYGKFSENDLVEFYALAKRGFNVIASNLRYVDELAQFDKLGGDEINDILNLIPIIRSFSFTDPKNIFMLGFSRGGQLTYKAIANQAEIRAAAIVAGVSNYELVANSRPEFINGWKEHGGFNGLARNLPNFELNKEQYLIERSAVKWADKLNTPLLILHARTDKLVPVKHALQIATELDLNNKVFSLVIYEDDGHSLPINRDDRNNRIVSWFNQFRVSFP